MIYAIQNGRDFYIFDGPNDEKPVRVSAPTYIRVRGDGDMYGALEARYWFRDMYSHIKIQ